ncbi:MAG: hypothetical protein LBK25_01205 [Treponema sp.]|nr:hypothetical protein [Treponema sp.]
MAEFSLQIVMFQDGGFWCQTFRFGWGGGGRPPQAVWRQGGAPQGHLFAVLRFGKPRPPPHPSGVLKRPALSPVGVSGATFRITTRAKLSNTLRVRGQQRFLSDIT